MNPADLLRSAHRSRMRIIRWLVWSPTRALALAVAAAVVLGAGLQVAQYQADMTQYRKDLAAYEATVARQEALEESDGQLPMFSVPVDQQPGGLGALDDDHGDAHLTSGEEATMDALTTAEQFVTTLAAGSTYLSVDEWVTDLEPFVSPALLPYLRETDPETAPTVTGIAYEEVGAYSGTVLFDTDAGVQLEVIVTLDGASGDWQVTDYGPVTAP